MKNFSERRLVAMYFALRLFRKLRYFLGPQSSKTYSDLGVFSSIVESDKFYWEQEISSPCLLSDYLKSDNLEHGKTILDFGGGGGRHGFEVIRANLVDEWHIVELPEFVNVAKKELKIPRLDFGEIIPNTEDLYFAGHASGSIQYTEDPMVTLENLTRASSDWLFLEKLAVTVKNNPVKFRQFALASEHFPERFRPSRHRDRLVSYEVICPSFEEVRSLIVRKFDLIEVQYHGPQLKFPLAKGLQMIDIVARRPKA